MAFNLWKMLGIEKKGAPDTSYLTQGVRPFQSLTEIPIGASLNDIIQKGLKGEGWGYDPSFVDKTTSPVVAQREARWKEQELPSLSSEMSSRGLGRSTIAQEGIARAQGAKERDINDIIGQAYLTNEQQKKADEARFQGLGQWYTGAESAQKGAYSADDTMRRTYALEKELGYQNEKENERIQNVNRTIGLGLTALYPPAGAMWSGATAGGAPAGGDLASQISTLTAKRDALTGTTQAANASSPFTGGNQGLIQMLKKLLQGGGGGGSTPSGTNAYTDFAGSTQWGSSGVGQKGI